MNKKAKTMRVPKLRFPEFQGDGEWGNYFLAEVAKVYQPKTISQSNLANTGYPVYGANGIIGYYSEYNHEHEQIAVTCRGSTCGVVNWTMAKSWITGNAMVINVDSNQDVIKKLIYYLLSNSNLKYLITGSGQPQITGNIKKHEVLLPDKKEQQKIADCLSSLDDLISAHSEKLSTLKNLKKGLMQQLFPREGESVPKLRFPEFQGDGDWEEKKLGEIGEFIGGGTPDTSVSEYWNGDIPWFTPTEIKQKNLLKSKRTITKKGLMNSSAKLLPKGTLLLSTRATVGEIGVSSSPCTINQSCEALFLNKDENNIFWYYWITQHKYKLIQRSSGSTFLSIGKDEIRKVSVSRPDKEEQQKIADCLSCLDDLISAYSEKLKALESHKKGLMQQLFPGGDKELS